VRSIRTKLTLIIVASSVLGVGLVGVSARWITHSQFNTFRLEQTRSAFIDAATSYYQQNGSWAGAEDGLQSEIYRILGVPDHLHPPPPGPAAPAGKQGATGENEPAGPAHIPAAGNGMSGVPVGGPGQSKVAAPTPLRRDPASTGNERLERRNPFALANVRGITVIGNHRWRLGQTIPARVLARGTPVSLNGTRIGTVTYDAPPELRTLERIYLRRTGQAISYAAIAAVALALLVGVLATRFLTRPVRDLTGAIRMMRGGALEQSVPIRSKDELGEMARAFNDMSAAVARGQRLREQMTADIAHDLRTPLSVLTGYLEGIRDGVLDATPATVETMYSEARQLQHLVEDLRTLSMADAGQLRLQREDVTASELLQTARQAFLPMAEQAGVRLDLALEEPGLRLTVDPSRMRQVLANLVANALQHTPRGGRVELSARSEQGTVVLQVADDGAGIPADALPHIFERFYRADAARSEGSAGSGLGLPIARSLVEAHGGTIAATSASGRGSIITIRLPVAAS
jgi:signal transduction histidine kinase